MNIDFNKVNTVRYNSKPVNKVRLNGLIIYSTEKAGLYDSVTGNRIYTWKQLLDKGYFTVQDNRILRGTSSDRFSDLTGDLYIPENIYYIGSSDISSNVYAPFYRLTGLNKVIIPNTVKSISRWAFNECGITTMALPDSVTSLGDSCFSDCENLEYFDFGNSITEIPMYCLESCHKLSFVRLSPKTKYINAYSFNYDTALKSIHLPNTVTSISGEASSYPYAPFYGCSPDMVIYTQSTSRLPNPDYANSYSADGKLEVKYGYTYEEYLEDINLPRPVTYTYTTKDFYYPDPYISNSNITGTALNISENYSRADSALYNIVYGQMIFSEATLKMDIAIASTESSLVIDSSNTNFIRVDIPKEYLTRTFYGKMPLSTPITLPDGGVAESIEFGWTYYVYLRLVFPRVKSSNGGSYPITNMRIAEFTYTKD